MKNLLSVLVIAIMLSACSNSTSVENCQPYTYDGYVDYDNQGYALFVNGSESLRVDMHKKTSFKYAIGAEYDLCFDGDSVVDIK
jgi:PBP1b-binding outer membrane lipoprotein LpoB